MKQSTFQFRKPVLEKFVFGTNLEYNSEKFDGMEFNATTHVERSKEKNEAIVKLNVKIGNKENAPFFIDVVMSSDFIWDDDNENVDIMLKSNAPSMLLSYIRPLVANITSNSEYPELDIPFMDFTNNAVEEK